MDRCSILHPLGYGCSSRHGRPSDLFSTPYRTQSTGARGHSFRLPAVRSPGPRRLRHYAIGQSGFSNLSRNSYTRSGYRKGRRNLVRGGLVDGAHYVGLCHRLAFLCARQHQPQQVPVQHGLVGLYIPARRVHRVNDDAGERNAVVVLRCAWYGTYSFLSVSLEQTIAGLCATASKRRFDCNTDWCLDVIRSFPSAWRCSGSWSLVEPCASSRRESCYSPHVWKI